MGETGEQRDWERLLSGQRSAGRSGARQGRPRPRAPTPVRRSLFGPAARHADIRDQFGLKIGWVRLWLRGVGLGVGVAFFGASLGLWKGLSAAAGPFFLVGIAIVPVAGALALLAWALPYPVLQTRARCPACGQEDVVLRLPWRTLHTCRHCRRKGYLERGELVIASTGDARGAASPGVR